MAQQTRCGLTAHLAAEMHDTGGQTLRSLRMRSHNRRASFYKRLLWTYQILAAKATNTQHQAYRSAADG